jgi:hypothetical protein
VALHGEQLQEELLGRPLELREVLDQVGNSRAIRGAFGRAFRRSGEARHARELAEGDRGQTSR